MDINNVLNKIVRIEAFRFLVAGVFNTILCYFIFVTFILYNFKIVYAMSFASAISIPVSYYLMSRYVFVSELSFKKGVSFILMQLSGYLINVNTLIVVVWFGISAYLGGIISMSVTAVVVFFISKFIVFKKLD